MTKASIYKVTFIEPPLSDDSRTEFYFSSLSAIYDTFTPKQVGCKVSRLWNVGVTQGKPYIGRLCQVTKEEIMTKAQKRPCNGRKSFK